MATGDKDPIKLEREDIMSQRATDDFLSPDETTPRIKEKFGTEEILNPKSDSSIILDSGEFVHPDPTNPPIYNIIDELIVCYLHTNYLRQLKKIYPLFVGKYLTILSSDLKGKILAKTRELKVFTVRTLYSQLGIKSSRAYIYDVLGPLEADKLIVCTHYTARVRKGAGRPPHFYRYTDVELEGWKDPQLKKAQREYDEAVLNTNSRLKDNLSTDNLQNIICREIVDKYKEKGRFDKFQAPKQPEVLKLLQADPRSQELGPTALYSLAKTISDELYSIRRTSP